MYTREEIKEAGLDDFRVFLCLVWAFLGLPKPTPVQLDMAYWLQHGPKRGILQAFRGVGKSWITVAFVLWLLFLDPQINVMVVSATEAAATNFSIFCKQLIRGMPLLQHLRPSTDQRDAADEWDVGPAEPDKNPSVKSVGITGQLTGSRADVIIADDTEVPKNSYTHLLRERLGELVKEFEAILKPLPDARITYLGTPQVEQTLYLTLENDRGYGTAIWPVELPANPGIYRGRLGPLIQKMLAAGLPKGTLVEPTRFGAEKIAAARASYGAAGFDMQFMLNTVTSDAEKYPLKLRDLIVHDVDASMGHVQLVWGSSRECVLQDLMAGGIGTDHYVGPAWRSPEMTKYTATCMAIDPSGQGKDETGYAIVKYLNGLLYLVDIGGFIDGFGEMTLRALAGKSLRWGVNDIIIETNYGGGMFDQLLKPHLIQVYGDDWAKKNNGERKIGAAGRIDDEYNGWSHTMKENRICDTLEPLLKSHRIVVSRAVIEADLQQQRELAKYSFIQQMTRMARIKGCLPHEDRLESFSMACAYFEEKMSKDASRSLETHRKGEIDKELKKFMKHAMNFGKKGSWSVRN